MHWSLVSCFETITVQYATADNTATTANSDYTNALIDLNWMLQIDPKNVKAFCLRGLTLGKLEENSMPKNEGRLENFGIPNLTFLASYCQRVNKLIKGL